MDAFVLKKILSAFLMPLPMGMIIFLIGLLYLYAKNHKKAKIYLSISFVWIFIVAYTPFTNLLLKPLETAYPEVQKDVSVKYILLLGGDYNNRSQEAMRLYNLIENSKIITSGYKGADDFPEAIRNADKLIKVGIPKKDIIMQAGPKDTKEEAISIKKIVGNEEFILVTSAYHMPRAMEIFKKEGLKPIAAPTFFLRGKNRAMTLPNSRDLFKSEVAFHEYLGILWNRLKAFKEKTISNK